MDLKLTYNQALGISTAWACIGIPICFSTITESFPLQLLGPLLAIGLGILVSSDSPKDKSGFSAA